MYKGIELVVWCVTRSKVEKREEGEKKEKGEGTSGGSQVQC